MREALASYEKNVRLHVTPHVGSIPLANLTSTRITALYHQLETSGRADHRAGEGLSPRTVRYVAMILSWRLERVHLIRSDSLIFADLEGQHLHPERFSRAFGETLARCRRVHPDLPVIRLYDLRHTHATLLLSKGVPAKAVSVRLGHSTAVVTMTVCAGWMPADDANGAAAATSRRTAMDPTRDRAVVAGHGAVGRDTQLDAWRRAQDNRADDGSLPSGKAIVRRYGRHERW